MNIFSVRPFFSRLQTPTPVIFSLKYVYPCPLKRVLNRSDWIHVNWTKLMGFSGAASTIRLSSWLIVEPFEYACSVLRWCAGFQLGDTEVWRIRWWLIFLREYCIWALQPMTFMNFSMQATWPARLACIRQHSVFAQPFMFSIHNQLQTSNWKERNHSPNLWNR